MTHPVEFKQSGHLNTALTDPATRAPNAEQLTGRWLNTNRGTRGISECVIKSDGGRLSVSVVGVGDEGPIHWPEGRARVLANLEEEAGQRTVALAVDFDFGFMRAETQIRVNKGVLVILLFNTFSDGGGRADYVTREFFYREM